jgi:hypothetical protein
MMANPERRQRLVDASERALEEKLIEQFKWNLPDSISKTCTDFIEAEIVPAVTAHLQKNKGALVQSAIEASDLIGEKLAEAMVTKAVGNLTGYRMGTLMKELFS